MRHATITQIQERVEHAKQDSHFTHFYSLLLQGEALFKLTVLGVLSGIANDNERNHYRLEHALLKADGLAPWARVLDDALTGTASQFLLTDLSTEKNELTKLCSSGSWQYESVSQLMNCLRQLDISAEELPTQSDMKRWFSLFTLLRNKTRGHGATKPEKTKVAAASLSKSISLFYENHSLYKRPWAYLYRNLSGKYRVEPITSLCPFFESLKKGSDKSYSNGIYILVGTNPRLVPFIETDGDLTDFFFPNGSFHKKTYESISYYTDKKRQMDGSEYLTPPGTLPSSETEGHRELQQLGRCFSNIPPQQHDYIARPKLESEVKRLVLDDRHPFVTMIGRGGIGKTSLALKIIQEISNDFRFNALFWFSARDVDLLFSGPKAVKPLVMTTEQVGQLYTILVKPKETGTNGFTCKGYFEAQLVKNDLGPCLYVFDNFETTQNPLELFSWLDTHIRLPNKILITTRLRDFKGDYPVEVTGMMDDEAEKLIEKTARQLDITKLISREYISELIQQSEGHPYVIKILLGEVAKEGKAGHIPRLVANRDEILTALFERTYASLPPCAQRAFMTLAAWNSSVPRVALEAVLHRAVDERAEVEKSIDLLLKYSLAEKLESVDGQDFIELPLVASIFGKKKLNVSPLQPAIKVDVELLQMLGPVHRGEIHISLAKRIDVFLGNIARRLEKGEPFEKYASIIELIGRNFPPAWLSLARLHMEQGTEAAFENAKVELRRYLEHDSSSQRAAGAWWHLSICCNKTKDSLGEVHAQIQRSKIASVPFEDLANTANNLSYVFRTRSVLTDSDEKRILAEELLQVMEARRSEASPEHYGQMAWLALRLKDYKKVTEYISCGLNGDPDNYHLKRLLEQPNVRTILEENNFEIPQQVDPAL